LRLGRSILTCGSDEVVDDDDATVAALQEIDARWMPVWSAWRGMRAAALGASSHEDHAADERGLASAIRAIEGTLPPPTLLRFRAMLARGGEVGARALRLRDVDADLSIILSARELARREHVKTGATVAAP
jgi:hypothetical protein